MRPSRLLVLPLLLGLVFASGARPDQSSQRNCGSPGNRGRAACQTPTPTVLSTPTVPATATATATATVALATATPTPVPTVAPVKWFGVNLSGAEFGGQNLPGAEHTDYTYPIARDGYDSYPYFAAKGLTLVRLPFLWERVQPDPLGPLDPANVADIRAVLDQAAANHQRVILDLHNFGRKYGQPLTKAQTAELEDVWLKLAQPFAGHPGLWGYELMNEPHDLPEGPLAWAFLAQNAVDAIRRVDPATPILVPGYGWESAPFWQDQNPGFPLAGANLVYAAHVYFDPDYSGAYAVSYDQSGASPALGQARLLPFRDWLVAHGATGMVTEYGVPDTDPRWNDVLDSALALVRSDPVFAGGTDWSAGPWWGSYPLSVEPVRLPDGSLQDRPQMAVLERYPSG